MSEVMFKINGDSYRITYQNMVFKPEDNEFSAEDVSVFRNGNAVDDFGTNFIGHKHSAEDILRFTVLAYINLDMSYEFNSVPDDIETVYAKYCTSFRSAGGRVVPGIIYNYDLRPLNLVMVTDSGAAYIGEDEDCILTNIEGAIMTDYFCFFIAGICQMFDEDNVFYLSDEAKMLISEYSEDDIAV